jgi:putative SOS response-associated peptidase YedK
MCGRYFLEASLDDIEALVGPLAAAPRLERRYNIAPEQPIPVVRNDAMGERHLALLRWGLVPAWSKGPDNRYSMINARAETVAEKPAYRAALRYRRCLVPASGFYEWRPTGRGHKQPFVIRRADHGLMCFAGLWEHWMGADGSELESCSIIVTEANRAVAPVHDRMPVILDPRDFDTWLDRGHQHTDDLLPLLKLCDPQALQVYRVSREVNNPQQDGARLIQPEESDELF